MGDVEAALSALAQRINRVNESIGHAVAWVVLALVVVQFTAVVLRYVFNAGWVWLDESIVYLHATIFMTGAAYTLLHDGHVRVDIFYRDASADDKARVDLLGAIFFLIPVSVLILVKSWPYVVKSWSILEGSPETSGIPAVFLLKSLIPLFAVMMIVQGFSMAVSAALRLRPGGEARR